jgi:xylulokinase
MKDSIMDTAKKYILAIDIGTSGPKAALIDTSGDVLDFEFKKIKLYVLAGGGVEQDPNQWWQAILEVSQRLLERVSIPRENIAGVCCTSQWSCTVAVDKAGNPLMNAISWMDTRGAAPLSDITDGLIKIEGYNIFKLIKWIRLTGGVPSIAGRDPANHILYIKTALPDIYKKTYKFLEARDYINLCLTGKFCTSPDCITLHWVTDNRDIKNVRYDDRLIKMLGIPREKLPDIRPSTSIISHLKEDVARMLGLDPATPVAMGSPDLHSAAIGAGATDDYAGHLYLGTSSWLICHMPDKKTDPFTKMASFPAAIPGKYLLLTEQQIAGEAFTILKDNLGFGLTCNTPEGVDMLSRFNRMAAQVAPGSGKLIFTPWFNGERTPVDDNMVRAGFHNLGLSTTQAHMVRAVFEGVAYNSKWMLTCVEKFIRRKMTHVNIIGGGAKSDLWCQIQADVLNRTIRRVKNPALCNARGAGFIAWVAMGAMTFDQIPEKTEFEKIFTPNPDNRLIYNELYQRFVELYHTNKKWYKKLNSG